MSNGERASHSRRPGSLGLPQALRPLHRLFGLVLRRFPNEAIRTPLSNPANLNSYLLVSLSCGDGLTRLLDEHLYS
ncbi:hypothetical protein TMatcc_001821 [Talaromyces marneffei ATCC 18224]